MRNHFSFEIPFMKYRKPLLTLSAIMTIIAIVGLIVRGLTFGIEFQGGTEIDFNGTGDISIEQMREALTDAGEVDPTIQTTTASDGENGFIVRSDTTDPNTANDHAKQAAETLELSEANYNVTTIGPDWGADVTRSSLMAFGLAILLIIGYVSIRYEFKMSITAVIALIHDMVIILGIYAWTQIPRRCATVSIAPTSRSATSRSTRSWCAPSTRPSPRLFPSSPCTSLAGRPSRTSPSP